MDYLQYFKDVYKRREYESVLNLVINGLPSILKMEFICGVEIQISFKPCYKWITFNTDSRKLVDICIASKVLNLVINGLPSILKGY